MVTDNSACGPIGSLACKIIMVYLNDVVVAIETGGAVTVNGSKVTQFPHIGQGELVAKEEILSIP